MFPEVSDDGTSLSFLPWRSRRARRFAWLCIAIGILVVGRAIAVRDFGEIVNALIMFTLGFVASVGVVRAAITPTFWRPVDAWRRRSWADVERVLTPGRYDDTTKLLLTDGSIVNTGFPAGSADRIAEISGKPLQPAEVQAPKSARVPGSPWRNSVPTLKDRADKLHARHIELMKEARTNRGESAD
ncbi:hypothetical protein [Flexivirga meconopsidis]|uniref:hypothetical protein n=1 Tax=Flexivirga meconopsidis TaxID=2977121 RepID=UPI00223E9FA5|nr:hypothetical protein [Flexivirga meconopsidis]